MEMLENLKVESTKKKIKRRIGKEEWIQRLLIIGMILAFFDYACITTITIVYTSFFMIKMELSLVLRISVNISQPQH